MTDPDKSVDLVKEAIKVVENLEWSCGTGVDHPENIKAIIALAQRYADDQVNKDREKMANYIGGLEYDCYGLCAKAIRSYLRWKSK